MDKLITICIPTYKRVRQLDKLLNKLKCQIDKMNNNNISIIVVDNDIDESARTIVESKKMDIHYTIELNKGVANVRNRCIEEAKILKSSYILFIDDDELPYDNWISNMYDTHCKYNADVVFGPVVPIYGEHIPKWIVKGKFFENPRYNTGDKIQYSGTGNCLISLEIIDRYNTRFDTNFNLSGGEDTDFFMRLGKLGANMVWCNEGIVNEEVAISRANSQWLKKRSFCSGNNYAICELKNIDGSIASRLKRLIKGLCHCVCGTLKLPMNCLKKEHRVKNIMNISAGFGQIIGSLGFNKGKQY